MEYLGETSLMQSIRFRHPASFIRFGHCVPPEPRLAAQYLLGSLLTTAWKAGVVVSLVATERLHHVLPVSVNDRHFTHVPF
jgi:hypothetical protein